MGNEKKIREVFERGEGVLRLIPTFVPRAWGKAGRRLRLHPDDYYALGLNRGEIKERWLSSINFAYSNRGHEEDEGLSYVQTGTGTKGKILLRDFVGLLGSEIIGEELMEKYGTMPVFSKLYDYKTPLFFHVHLTFETAANVGRLAKPESYYYPPQLNTYEGDFPYSFLGFDPSVTKEQVRECLEKFETDDNRITELSRAYRLKPGTGWFIPAGIIHAPGSFVTYEPQWNSDVRATFDNVTAGEVNTFDKLAQFAPNDKKHDIDYLMTMLDWEKNVDPNFRETYARPPVTAKTGDGYVEKWISYGNEYFSAKELTIEPGKSVVISDSACYGCILLQGHGEFGVYKDAESAQLLRFGQASADEYFVSEAAAKKGIRIANHSSVEPMVILKHFGPNNPDAPIKSSLSILGSQ